jgi:hypothetical protein
MNLLLFLNSWKSAFTLIHYLAYIYSPSKKSQLLLQTFLIKNLKSQPHYSIAYDHQFLPEIQILSIRLKNYSLLLYFTPCEYQYLHGRIRAYLVHLLLYREAHHCSARFGSSYLGS